MGQGPGLRSLASEQIFGRILRKFQAIYHAFAFYRHRFEAFDFVRLPGLKPRQA